MKILSLDEIKEILSGISDADLLRCIEQSFVQYSDGSANIPPVGHLGFEGPAGDVHIKYGHIIGDPNYVIKIASGFYENPKKGLPPGNGMMIVFDAETGVPGCLLRDEGYLTDLRTALAGAVAAKYLAPKDVTGIGIIGTGVQARMQLEMLKLVTDCREVFVWGRTKAHTEKYAMDMSKKGFHLQIAASPLEVASNCQLLVTTTPSTGPILMEKDIGSGTHITAMGSDAPGKQELDPNIFGKASIIACDSRSQCLDHGESHFAKSMGKTMEEKLVEMGQLIPNPRRRSDGDITIADLTGIATQDIRIASLVLENL